MHIILLYELQELYLACDNIMIYDIVVSNQIVSVYQTSLSINPTVLLSC